MSQRLLRCHSADLEKPDREMARPERSRDAVYRVEQYWQVSIAEFLLRHSSCMRRDVHCGDDTRLPIPNWSRDGTDTVLRLLIGHGPALLTNLVQ